MSSLIEEFEKNIDLLKTLDQYGYRAMKLEQWLRGFAQACKIELERITKLRKSYAGLGIFQYELREVVELAKKEGLYEEAKP